MSDEEDDDDDNSIGFFKQKRPQTRERSREKENEKSNNISRKEYLQLRNVFGDEIMVTGEYTENTKPIKFNYTLDPEAFNKKAYFYYYDKINIDGELVEYVMPINDDNGEIL